MSVTFIGLTQSLAIARALGFHVRDSGLLDSALARPSSAMFGVEAYPELEHKAAALMSSLAQNHPLFDGNKPFAWVVTLTFLELNGRVIEMPDDVAFDFVLDVARSRLDLDAIAALFVEHTAPLMED